MESQGSSIVFHVGGVPTAAWVLNKVLDRSSQALQARGVRALPPAEVHATIKGNPKVIDVPKLSALVHAGYRGGVRTLVASTETVLGPAFRSGADGLFPDSGPLLEALAAATDGRRRVIVLSTCPQAHFLELYFRRMVRLKTWASFPEWLGELDLDQLSWVPLHRRLTQTFGAEAVHVVPFTGSRAGRDDFARRVADLIDGGLAGELASAPRPGAELSQKGLELGIAASPYLRSKRDRQQMREFLNGNFNDKSYPIAEVPSEEQRRLDDRYGDDFLGVAR